MKYDIPFKNNSGEEIPPYGVFKASGIEMVGSRALIVAEKPDTYGSQYLHFVNGITAVADGKCGSCCNTFPCIIKHSVSPVTYGVSVGPINDSWEVHLQSVGFICLGSHGENMIVARAPMLAFTGKFDADVSQGSQETVSVYWNGGDTTYNVDDVYAVSGDFATTDDVNVSWMNERWEAYCRNG